MITAKKSFEIGAEHEIVTTLLEEHRMEDGLLIEYLFYRISLKCGSFYFVSVEIVNGISASADVALLGGNQSEAESLFQKLVRGSVLPSTLREIVSDLCE